MSHGSKGNVPGCAIRSASVCSSRLFTTTIHSVRGIIGTSVSGILGFDPLDESILLNEMQCCGADEFRVTDIYAEFVPSSKNDSAKRTVPVFVKWLASSFPAPDSMSSMCRNGTVRIFSLDDSFVSRPSMFDKMDRWIFITNLRDFCQTLSPLMFYMYTDKMELGYHFGMILFTVYVQMRRSDRQDFNSTIRSISHC